MLIAITIAEMIQGLGRKKDSLELKAIKAQIIRADAVPSGRPIWASH